MRDLRPHPRILVVTSTFPRWTGDRVPPFVLELCRRLSGQFQVHVCAPHAAGAAREETMDGISVHRYRYAPAALETLAYDGGILSRLRERPARYLLVPCLLFAQYLAVRALIRRYRFDAIHAHWILPQGLLSALAAGPAGPPVVVTSHGADLYSLRHPLLQRLKRWTLRRAAAVTVVSQAMCEQAGKLAEGVAVDVIPMGTDLAAQFVPDDSAVREAGLVLFVGRLVQKKGVDVLLRAFGRVHERVSGSRLLIVGDGPERRSLEQLADRLALTEVASFAGALPKSELPALYRRAAVTAVPSVVTDSGDQEGLGLVIVEAMGCASPVVVSDLAAVRDLARDGETARVVPPADPQPLAEALIGLLGDAALRRRLGEAGRQWVAGRFDWSVSAARYRALLESVARAGRETG